MRSTYITATVIAVLVVIWLASGQLRDQPPPPAASVAEQNRNAKLLAEEKPAVSVRVTTLYGSEHWRHLTVRGETRSKRTVQVKAQANGTLVQRQVERGYRVSTGDVMCQISEEDRVVAVNEDKEALQQAKIEYEGSQRLAREGLQSQTLIAQARARLAAAEANLKRSELALGRLQITAPFDGVVENVGLEVGDYVTPGSTCATLVALDPMLLIGRVSERQVSSLEEGQIGRARLPSGEIVEGKITFIGHVADSATRTYAVELEFDNADFAIASGLTAEIDIPVQRRMAHKVSPGLLSLDDSGNVGLRTVDANNQVEFYLIEIIDDVEDGVWVTGLPEVATIITVGHELVVAGETVDPQIENLNTIQPSDPDVRDPSENTTAQIEGESS